MKKILGMSMFMLVTLGCMSSSVSAQDKWETQVRNQLNRIAVDLYEDEGFGPAFDPMIGSLKHNQHQDLTYRLVGGIEYVFAGTCDEDCRDLDFKLFGGSTKIQEDIRDNDAPLIFFTPTSSGTYTLRVIMAKCNKDPCKYGVGAFD